MFQENIDQIIRLIDKSKRILLLTHAKADCDGLGAMISMYLVLKELGKEVTAITSDPTPKNLNFLPAVDIIQNSLSAGRDFIITLDCSKTPVNKIKYNLENNRVNIIVTPKGGNFSASDVTFSEGGAKFDLIISFDAGNLEHLGPVYDQNTEMFFNTPIINIDHHASNTDFGQVNLVDIMGASTTEVLFFLLQEAEKKYNKTLITEDIATLLLAGIITDTGSFQHANTSPRSMETAAKLLDLGARQQEIIKNIYKTKKLSTLKLWGIVLSKVQTDPVHRIVWSTISKRNLEESGATAEETGDIIDELLSNAPGAEIIFMIKYNEGGFISVSMRSTNNQTDVGKFAADHGGGGHVRASGYKITQFASFEEEVSNVIAQVKAFQAQRLNIHPEDLAGAQNLPAKPPIQAVQQQQQPQPPAQPAPKTPASAQPIPAKTPAPATPATPVAPIAPIMAPKPTQPPKPAQPPKPTPPPPISVPGKPAPASQNTEKATYLDFKTTPPPIPGEDEKDEEEEEEKPAEAATPAPVAGKAEPAKNAQPEQPAPVAAPGGDAPRPKRRRRKKRHPAGTQPQTGAPTQNSAPQAPSKSDKLFQ
jgi:phosphoesterase RecJ-like protein